MSALASCSAAPLPSSSCNHAANEYPALGSSTNRPAGPPLLPPPRVGVQTMPLGGAGAAGRPGMPPPVPAPKLKKQVGPSCAAMAVSACKGRMSHVARCDVAVMKQIYLHEPCRFVGKGNQLQ